MSERYKNRMELLQGTLDLLILQTLMWGPQHGYGISQAIRANSGDLLKVDAGSLYPALHRLEDRGDAHLPRFQPAASETLSARDGRQECDAGDAERRSRRGGRRGDALRVRAAEPEVQRDVARVEPRAVLGVEIDAEPRRRARDSKVRVDDDERFGQGRGLRAFGAGEDREHEPEHERERERTAHGQVSRCARRAA